MLATPKLTALFSFFFNFWYPIFEDVWYVIDSLIYLFIYLFIFPRLELTAWEPRLSPIFARSDSPLPVCCLSRVSIYFFILLTLSWVADFGVNHTLFLAGIILSGSVFRRLGPIFLTFSTYILIGSSLIGNSLISSRKSCAIW